MALIKREGEHYSFIRGKHQGETLDDVAASDPSYLQWMFENATEDLDDEAFHALEDVMEENSIDFP
jgi:hypothetical protein